MVMPSIAESWEGASGCDLTASLSGAFRAAFRAGFLADFFGGGFFVGAGMDMPGMCCAAAGAASNTLAANESERDFRANSLKRSALDLWIEDALNNSRSAAAVLAGAGIAAASRTRGAATIRFRLPILAIRHFSSPFRVAQNERITI
jgi:hypothetical protein